MFDLPLAKGVPNPSRARFAVLQTNAACTKILLGNLALMFNHSRTATHPRTERAVD